MPLPDSDDEAAKTVPSAKEQTPLASPQPLANLEHPWLGLESFREETRAYFFGRDAEIVELHLRLRSGPLLVLNGRTGLGKTSILLAGLIPRLRAEKQSPLLLRLWYGKSAQDVCDQLVSAVFGWGDRQTPRPTKSLLWTRGLSEKLGLSLPDDIASHLWLRLHYRDEPPDITHLILDQFEEVFTLGARLPGAEEKVRDTLAILLQGAVPEPIGRLISEHDSFSDDFNPDSVPVRIILALRSDYVYALNRWRRHLPALGQNNFELRALRGLAAFDAVFKPGELRCNNRGDEVNEENKAEIGIPPIIAQETAQRIVRFIAQKGDEVPIEEIEAVPPILSLLCRELNERRFTGPAGTPETPADQITFRENEADVETIIAAFYERCLAGRPEAVGMFIEEKLVSYSGARLAHDEKSLLQVFEKGCEIPGAGHDRRAAGFGDAIAALACLRELVNQRLLSSVGSIEKSSYELIHDLLAAVVERRRTARKERLEKEAERKAKDDAEARARESAKRAAVLDAALKRAVASKKAADELINFMQYGLSERLGKLGRLDLMNAINARILKYHEEHPPEPGDEVAKDAADRERSVALNQQGDILRDKGQLPEALKAYRDSLEIAERLTKKDPNNTVWQHDLSVSYVGIGDVRRAQNDLSAALKSFSDCLGIREKLAKQDRGNALWQRDLSVSYNKVGDVQSAQGDLAGALKSFRESLGITEKLADQDPGNAHWQRDLSISYEKVGYVLGLHRDFSGALKSYFDGVGILEKLAKQDPGNADWQYGLSAIYNNVGYAQYAQGDFSGALKSFRESLEIIEKLAKQDPGNAFWQGELAWVCWQMGLAWAKAEPRSKNEARAMVKKARDILRQLKEHRRLAAYQQKWLDSIEVDLRKMQENK